MALRFKNNGNGTTADGAILAANPDEFQEALNYTDNTHTIKYIELEADLDLNYSASWYYRMTDIFNVNGMTNTGNTVVKTVINGKGHSITNIYVFPNCAIFGTISGMANTAGSVGYCIFELNDITFEAILQKGAGFFSHSNRQDGPSMPQYRRFLSPVTNGCIFNVKVDNSMNNRGNNSLVPFNYHETAYWEFKLIYPRAINCIFNIYISAASNDNNCLFSVKTNSATDFSAMTIFESCEFRIRNNTDKLMSIFKNIIGDNNHKFLIDNCSFFLADIKQYDDPSKRTTVFSENKRHDLGFSIRNVTITDNYPKCKFYNSFIAAFGDDFNSGSNDPIYIDGYQNDTNRYEFATSFYDKSKIRFCNYYEDIPLESTGFSALTTAECKDKRALSDIGYLFAEEI
ncbi:MAG: hypothetical protein VZR64_00250 [Eubacterium sp.]|nr:hypothetical protein [Eubacterium sp.]